MFTGIVTDIGRVHRITHEGILRLVIETAYNLDTVAIGASIACSGCCLTVTAKTANSFTADVSAETLAITTLGGWREGQRINLERSLKLGDELGGHLVQGHVDGVAQVLAREPDGASVRFSLRAPGHLARFIAPKGSVALDGTSLTVNGVTGDVFDVNLIPHTLAATIWGTVQPGDTVNLEIDLLARYVARLAKASS